MPADYRDFPTADGFIRRLGLRYFCVLAAVGLLVVLDQALVQPMLVRIDRYGPAINLSGRQRMLSQRLTKAALRCGHATSAEDSLAALDELQTTLREWTEAHRALQDGDPSSGVRCVTNTQIRQQWLELEPHYTAMVEATRLIMDANRLSPAATRQAVNTIASHEAQFLASMERIVGLMEAEAAREVQQLRAVALAVATSIVALIVGLGWFVVRPAIRVITAQVDQLEARVSLRTRELNQALDALRRECSQRESVEHKNRRLAAQLAHADRVESMGHLAVGLAHELNHPLGTIANYAEACDVLLKHSESTITDTKFREYVQKILEAALRGGALVQRMRNFVQPGGGDVQDVDISDLIQEIVALCRNEIDRHDTLLTVDIGSNSPRVQVDVIQIQQVLVNLIQNALQAMAEGNCDKRHLMIEVTCRSESVRIDVSDSGPGFSNIDEPVFEPFRSTKPDGLGVGLSICRSIIEYHGGTIWIGRSRVGGAAVSFTLPMVLPHADAITQSPHRVCC